MFYQISWKGINNVSLRFAVKELVRVELPLHFGSSFILEPDKVTDDKEIKIPLSQR